MVSCGGVAFATCIAAVAVVGKPQSMTFTAELPMSGTEETCATKQQTGPNKCSNEQQHCGNGTHHAYVSWGCGNKRVGVGGGGCADE